MSIGLGISVLTGALEVVILVIKRFESVKEANERCKKVTKRLQDLQEKIEMCLEVTKDDANFEVKELNNFKKNITRVEKICSNYSSKGNTQKFVSPFSNPGKVADDIDEEISSAENNFNMFISVNNFKMLFDVQKLHKRTDKLIQKFIKEQKETSEASFKSLQDAIEDIKSQLAYVHLNMQKGKHETFEQNRTAKLENECQENVYQLTKCLSQYRQAQQMDQQTKAIEKIHQQAEKLQKGVEMIDHHAEKLKDFEQKIQMVMQMQDERVNKKCAVAKCPHRCHKIVTILRSFKRGPKLIRNAVNSVQAFFKFGFAGLKLYTEDRSSKERMKHLQENSKRQSMSKSYIEKHRYHIQLITNESSEP